MTEGSTQVAWFISLELYPSPQFLLWAQELVWTFWR